MPTSSVQSDIDLIMMALASDYGIAIRVSDPHAIKTRLQARMSRSVERMPLKLRSGPTTDELWMIRVPPEMVARRAPEEDEIVEDPSLPLEDL